MTKKEIIIEYLSKEGNKEKSVRNAIKEIAEIYGINVSTGMYSKTAKELSEQQSEHLSEQQSEHLSEQQSEQQSEHLSEQQSEQQKVSSEQKDETVSRIDWLETLMEGIKKSTNIFQMAEAFRQCDVFVQTTGESIKDDIECLIEELLPWQKSLIYTYGLDKRVCMNL